MKKPGSPLPFWGMVATLVACAGALYVVMPNESNVLERLVRDGKIRRAYQVWKTVAPEEVARDPAAHQLMGLHLQRRLIDPDDPEDHIVYLLEQALEGYRRYRQKDQFFAEILALTTLLPNPEAQFDLIGACFDQCQAEERLRLMRAVVKHALECAQPEIAARSFERCWAQLTPSEENVTEYVRLWRSADEPEKALRILEKHEKAQSTSLFSFSPTLGRLRIDLLRELGFNDQAFTQLHAIVVATNSVPAKEDLDLLRATAAGSAQQKSLAALYQVYLRTQTNDVEIWRDFAEISMFVDDFPSAEKAYQKLIDLKPDDATAVRALAQMCEWSAQPGRAFDLYLRMAQHGDDAALERLVELNPGLYRDEELIGVLRRSVEHRPEHPHQLLLARLLTKHGEYDSAERSFDCYLREHPKDEVAWRDYGQMLQRLYRYQKASEALARVCELSPTNLTARATIAELYYRQGNFEESFRAYQRLAPATHDPEVLRCYANLAEALGRFDDVAAALSRQLQLNPNPPDSSFLKLAYVYSVAGDETKRRDTLEEAVRRFPTNGVLQLQLAVVLVEQQERTRALQVLSQHPELKTRPAVLAFYLNLLVERREYTQAAKFLRSGIDPQLLAAPHLAVLCALVHEGTGDYAAAEQSYRLLYLTYPDASSYALGYATVLAKRRKFSEAERIMKDLLQQPSAEVLGEAARLYLDMGKPRQAEELQRRFLTSADQPTFRDWSYLGDICAAAGHRSRAREAYHHALHRLQERAKPK